MVLFMNALLQLRYWFEPLPGSPNLLFWRTMIGIAILCIMTGVVAIIFIRRHRDNGIRKKLWFKISTWAFTIGPLVLVLAFFRFQNAYFLSMRLLVAIAAFGAALWAAMIFKYGIRDLPRRLKAQREEEAFRSYLPQRK